jgi:hypothetical protein
MPPDLPQLPPRPDMAWEGPPPIGWRYVEPGRMGAGAITGAGIRVWAANWLPWFAVTLLMTGAIGVIIVALDPWAATYGFGDWFGERPFSRPDPNPLAVVLTLVNVLVLGPWEIVILTRAALRATFSDPPRGFALIGRTIRGVHSMLWILVLLVLFAIPFGILLVGLLHAIGPEAARTVAAFVPLALFLWLAPRLATLADVFVAEDERGTRAIRGAWRLSRGAWPTSAGTVVLILLIGIVPGMIVTEMFPDPVVGDAVGRTIVQSVLNAILTPMGTAVVAAMYLELRGRKGIVDQASLRSNLARFD